LLKDENNEGKNTSERLFRQIKDLKTELRRSEFEIGKFAEEKHQETNAFISNLPNKSKETEEIEEKEGKMTYKKGFY